MPSKSKAQQIAMGMALAAKRGEISKRKLKKSTKKMLKMPEEQLEEFARTPRKGLPRKVRKRK